MRVEIRDKGLPQICQLDDPVKFQNFLKAVKNLFGVKHCFFSSRTQSFAPIRSKPQRTYNPLKEAATPEGSDMPVLLMNMSKAE